MSPVRRIQAGTDLLGGRVPVGCDACGAAFLAPPEAAGTHCPLCAKAVVGPRNVQIADGEPERLVPFGASREDLLPALRAFAGIWFPCPDLTAERLAERAIPLWWPMWLIDATCEGPYEAEVGFDFEVQSSEEALDNGSWTSRQVTRTKIRWEARRGAVSRRYDNVSASAVASHEARWTALGGYDTRRAVDFTPDKLSSAWLELPDRTPTDAWEEAVGAFDQRVGADVGRAILADHTRGARFSGDYADRVFTWQLLPVYSSWYLDDAGVRHPVLFHGITGAVIGRARASARKGWLWAAALATVAALLLSVAVVSVLFALIFPPLMVLSMAVGAVALAMFLAALWPPYRVWSTNRGG